MPKLKNLLVSLALLGALFCSSQALAKDANKTIKVGEITVNVITDGQNNFKADLFPTLDKYPEAKKLMHDNAFAGTVRTFLVHLDKRLILIDGGWGVETGRIGKTVENLKALGYEPAAITDILLTHLDIDHVSGLIHNGQRVYPKATLWLNEKQHTAWTKGEPRFKQSVDKARSVIKAYKDAGKLSFYKWGEEVFPKIMALQADGHTPGHTVFRLTSGKEHLYLVGDLLHAGDLQLAHPECNSVYDANPERAASVRHKVLQRCADEKSMIAGAHFIPIGVVKVSGTGFKVDAK